MIDSDGVRLAPQLLALSLALAACADPFAAATFGPQEVVLDALEVEIDFSPMGPPGTLNIQSRSIGGHALSFGFSDHLEMVASTSAGDFEILQLWPTNCRTKPPAPGWRPDTGLYRCDAFTLETESVAAFDNLRPLIAKLPGIIPGEWDLQPRRCRLSGATVKLSQHTSTRQKRLPRYKNRSKMARGSNGASRVHISTALGPSLRRTFHRKHNPGDW